MNGAAMIYPGEGKKGQPRAGDYVLAAEQTRAEAAASPDRSTAVDLARADKWEGQARTKQLPSTRTEIAVEVSLNLGWGQPVQIIEKSAEAEEIEGDL
jgi:hypothetical protein